MIKFTHSQKFNDNLIKMLAKNTINKTLDGIFSLDPEFLVFRSKSGAVGKPGALFYHFLGQRKKQKKREQARSRSGADARSLSRCGCAIAFAVRMRDRRSFPTDMPSIYGSYLNRIYWASGKLLP